jgi:hypothetical protein
LLEQAGQDATESFDEIGHSDDAKDQLAKYYIGDVENTGAPPKPKPAAKTSAPAKKDGGYVSTFISFHLTMLIQVFDSVVEFPFNLWCHWYCCCSFCTFDQAIRNEWNCKLSK